MIGYSYPQRKNNIPPATEDFHARQIHLEANKISVHETSHQNSEFFHCTNAKLTPLTKQKYTYFKIYTTQYTVRYPLDTHPQQTRKCTKPHTCKYNQTSYTITRTYTHTYIRVCVCVPILISVLVI